MVLSRPNKDCHNYYKSKKDDIDADFLPKIYFNKMNHVNLALGDCPDFLFGAFTSPADKWAAVSKAAAAAAPLPSPPGSPAHASHGSPSAPQRDALCIEHLAMLDGALCRTYEARHNIWIR